jgi:hypothetical protein
MAAGLLVLIPDKETRELMDLEAEFMKGSFNVEPEVTFAADFRAEENVLEMLKRYLRLEYIGQRYN